MTNEPEMTLSQAQAWIKANWASENFDRYKFAEAKGFIFGHAAASKRVEELERALKEAVDFVRMTRFKWDDEIVCGHEKEDCDTHKFRVKANKFLESVRKVLP